jgi:hypothetical protein
MLMMSSSARQLNLDHLAQILKQRTLDEPELEDIMTALNLTMGFGLITVFEDSGWNEQRTAATWEGIT